MGRWLSRDPIAEKGGWNLYGMVKNAVLKHFDLLGLKIPISLDEASNMILHYSCINSANAAFESGMEKCEGENCRSAKLKCYGRISRWHRNAVSTCDEQYGGNGPTTFPADLPDYGQPWWITAIEKINDAFAAQSKSRWN